MNKNILITGATGGLGLALTQRFSDAGYTVTATGRSARHAHRFHQMNARFIPADITQPDAIAALCLGQDAVIHAAALSASWGRREDFERTNVEATQDLVTQAQIAGVRRFVFISSPSVMTAMKDQVGQTESDLRTYAPLNDYARTKLAAEQYVLAADSDHFKTVALRPRALIGPDDQVLLPQIMALVKKGRLPLLRGGQARVDLTDVRDAAMAAYLALEKIDSVHGRFFHISGGMPVNMKDLTCEMADICGLNMRFFPFPMTLAKAVAYIAENIARLTGAEKEPALTRYKLATMAYSQTFDLTAAASQLGYHPAYNAKETLIAILKGLRHETL